MKLSNRLLVAGVVSLAASLPLAQVTHAEPPAPTVPTDIKVPDGNKVFLVGHAVGVQIYTCTATAGGYAWGPATPRADLHDDHGKVIATHFGGPTWQAKDGSRVVGQRVNGVTVEASAIQWLLLSKVSTSAGAGGDRLVGTTYIQRVATVGGLPPAAGACNATAVGSVQETPYTADYYFWKKSA